MPLPRLKFEGLGKARASDDARQSHAGTRLPHSSFAGSRLPDPGRGTVDLAGRCNGNLNFASKETERLKKLRD